MKLHEKCGTRKVSVLQPVPGSVILIHCKFKANQHMDSNSVIKDWCFMPTDDMFIVFHFKLSLWSKWSSLLFLIKVRRCEKMNKCLFFSLIIWGIFYLLYNTENNSVAWNFMYKQKQLNMSMINLFVDFTRKLQNMHSTGACK